MNNRGQFGLVTFLGIAIVLLAIAPILLNIVTTMIGGVGDGLEAVDPVASGKMQEIEDKFTGMWDYVIMFFFLFNVILLLISSFFIDTHPVFLILYIFVSFLIFVFAPYLVDTIDRIWDTTHFITDGTINELGMSGFVVDNFGIILLAIYFLSGLIIYGKIKYFSNSFS